MNVATLNIEQLKNRFFLENAPHWWLYNIRGKELLGKFRDDDSTVSDEEKTLYSWLQLEQLLQDFRYGTGKIVLKKNPSDNIHNSPQLHVAWGQKADNVIGSTTTAYNGGGGNMEAMYEKILQMQEKSHQQQLDLVTKLMETRFDKERLEEAIEGMASPSVSEELLRGGLDILKGVVMQPRPQGQLGTLSMEGENPNPTSQNSTLPPTDRPFSVDQVVADAAVIKQALPQYNPNDVIRAIALFAHKNPDQAANYIGMLMQTVGK